MASSQSVAGVSTQRKNVSMRQADAFDVRRYLNCSPRTSHGCPCPLEVCNAHQVRFETAMLTVITVQFLDESSEVRSQYTEEGSHPFTSPPAALHDSPKPGSSMSARSQQDVPSPPYSIVTPTDGFTVLSLLNSESPGLPPSHHTPSTAQSDGPRHDTYPQNEPNTFVYQQPPGEPILWPLEHEQEAMLLQHYIDNVALFVSST